MTAFPERRVAGQVFALGDRLFVARYPLSTALPVPLAVRGAELLTWAFAGLGRAGADPVALLVFTADAHPEHLVVATHFHDLTVTSASAHPAADLHGAERAALCPAVLGALTPATLAPLAGLLPLLGTALSALAATDDGSAGAAPALALTDDGSAGAAPALALTGEAGAILTGSPVPSYLMLRSGAVWRCRHVVRARLHFGSEPRAILDLAQAWGEPTEGPADAALLIRPGGIVAARVLA